MGIPASWYQPKFFLTSATERRAPDWTGTPRNVQVCIGRWAQTPARIGLDRRADRSVVLRWGYDALILRGRA